MWCETEGCVVTEGPTVKITFQNVSSMEPQRERSPLDVPQRQKRVCRYQDIKRDFFVFRLPTHPTQCNFPKECQVKHYLAGIRETDSRIRRIVKEGSAGTPLSPTVEFGNSLNKTWKDWFTDFVLFQRIQPLPCKPRATSQLLFCHASQVL